MTKYLIIEILWLTMVAVRFYRDEKGCPVKDWLDRIGKKAKAKGEVRIERLGEIGHEMRRPEADYLRDGVYELRWRLQSANYRILYFFHDREAVVLAHGLTKEDVVPESDIETAVRRKGNFERDPNKHTEER